MKTIALASAILLLASVGNGVANDQPKPVLPDLIDIPAGRFIMGCIPERDAPAGDCPAFELPAHPVQLNGFQIGKHEVTFAEWDACTQAGACPQADDYGWGRGQRPVVNVSWVDVQHYIAWLNQASGLSFRLPTEAEWEYAARGGGNTTPPQQASCNDAAFNYRDCQRESTQPVGSYAANAYGLHDMAGNVWEWVQDWYSPHYYRTAPAQNPTGANSGRYRLLRGGSWNDQAGTIRPAYRGIYAPVYRSNNTGFRLVLDKKIGI